MTGINTLHYSVILINLYRGHFKITEAGTLTVALFQIQIINRNFFKVSGLPRSTANRYLDLFHYEYIRYGHLL